MMRLPALARSAALSLRPGPNPLAFPGLVVAAVALGFAVLTAPKLYALSVIGATAPRCCRRRSPAQGDQGDPGRRGNEDIVDAITAVAAARDVGAGLQHSGE